MRRGSAKQIDPQPQVTTTAPSLLGSTRSHFIINPRAVFSTKATRTVSNAGKRKLLGGSVNAS